MPYSLHLSIVGGTLNERHKLLVLAACGKSQTFSGDMCCYAVDGKQQLTREVVGLENRMLYQYIACSPSHNMVWQCSRRPKRNPRQVCSARGCRLCRLSRLFGGHWIRVP